jgi:predicted dehydrogenase
LKVGVIGLGVMGKNHARVLSNMASVDELVLYDPMGADIGRLHGRAVSDNLESFLDQKFDYCVVSSPTSTHRDIALKLACLNTPTLIEKPLAFSVDDALQISEEFEKRGLLGAVGHIERFNPAIIALREKLATGVLGKMLQITTRRVGPYSGRIRDVGVVKDLATHDIDLVCFLSGSNYERIHAQTTSPLSAIHEDSLMAMGVLETGVQFSHAVNWISPKKERVTSVLGEKGLLMADTLTGDLYFYENGTSLSLWGEMASFRGVTEGAVHKFELVKEEPLVAEHKSFQSSLIYGSEQNACSLTQGVNVIRVAERMLREQFS